MISQAIKNRLRILFTDELGIPVQSLDFSPVGGGSINEAYQAIINKKEKYFCKVNVSSKYPRMFEMEKAGLELLASRNIIRVPNVVTTFTENDNQLLLLDWIEQGSRSDSFWKLFGQQLAALHSTSSPPAGLPEDNYMGALPQSNQPSESWIDFFIHRRLEPQVRLAVDNGLLQQKHRKQFEKVYNALSVVFPANSICLLHGDLWSGNLLCDHKGNPVLIDPAVYHGHPSMDLGMTTLFGGFDRIFMIRITTTILFRKTTWSNGKSATYIRY